MMGGRARRVGALLCMLLVPSSCSQVRPVVEFEQNKWGDCITAGGETVAGDRILTVMTSTCIRSRDAGTDSAVADASSAEVIDHE